MNRRDFLKGLGLTGAVTVAAGMGVGCASQSLADTGDPNTIAWDDEADVIVIGAGASGEMAALEACNQGLSAIVLEVMTSPMGASYVTGANMLFVDTGEEGMTATCDDLYNYWVSNGQGGAIENVCRRLADQNPSLYRRLVDMGIEFTTAPFALIDDAAPVLHSPVGRGGTVAGTVARNAENAGRKLITGARARHLMLDESGVVIGVKAETTSGEKLYGARKGVVLASGTFLRNERLLKTYGMQYAETLADNTMAGSEDMGDGLVMATEIGAATHLLGEGVFPHGYTTVGTVETDPIYRFAWFGGLAAGGVLVNMDGVRFVAEDSLYHPVIDLAMMKQPSRGVTFCVYDSIVHEAMGAIEDPSQMIGDNAESLAAAIAAKYSDFDKKAFVAALAAYNEAAASGEVDELGRQNMRPLSGTLYAIPTQVEVNVTGGGVLVDEESRVISYYTDEPIPGLYAAGVVSGAIQGYGMAIPGGSWVATGMIQGILAAQHIAANR